MQTEMMTGESSRETEEEADTSHVLLLGDSRRGKCARLWRRRTARETCTPWAIILTRREATATSHPQPPSG